MFYFRHMERLDEKHVSEAILQASAWALIGVTMPEARMRERAAAELAQSIVARLDPPSLPDPDQLTLL